MRTMSTRATVISGTAIGVALLWGAVECLALFWSRFSGRFRTQGPFPTR
jgi:hypothetical protein